jgi:HSP20 family protein
MSLIPYRPFWNLDSFFNEDEWPENIFSKNQTIKIPRLDIFETEKEVVAEIELPGVDPKNIDVEIKDNALIIEIKREDKKEEKEKGYYKKELSRDYHKRAIPLPVEVKEEKTKADYKEGILKIVMPKVKPIKREDKKGVKVKIRSAKTK